MGPLNRACQEQRNFYPRPISRGPKKELHAHWKIKIKWKTFPFIKPSRHSFSAPPSSACISGFRSDDGWFHSKMLRTESQRSMFPIFYRRVFGRWLMDNALKCARLNMQENIIFTHSHESRILRFVKVVCIFWMGFTSLQPWHMCTIDHRCPKCELGSGMI